jgi:phage replication-related protein YjqB (UPF0714/DUF867 family)
MVVAIHGCEGGKEMVLLGGLDTSLKERIAEALAKAGVPVEIEGHSFPATNPRNICNRGESARGVQLELTAAIRVTFGGDLGHCGALSS